MDPIVRDPGFDLCDPASLNARAEGYAFRVVAALLIDAFRPRMDIHAQRIDDIETAARLDAWEAEHPRPGVAPRRWSVGEWRPAGRKGARRPVSVSSVALHAAGLRTLGFYPMHPDGTVNSVSADFDNHRGDRIITRDARMDFDLVVAWLEAHAVPYLAHHSRGGKGYWIHLLLPKPTPAREARAVFHGILRESGALHVADGGTFDALFPKQDEATPPNPADPASRPGNLFCLPLSLRWLRAKPAGSGFVGVDPSDLDAQVEHLQRARRVPEELWRSLADRHPFVPRPAPARRTASPRVAAAAVVSSPSVPANDVAPAPVGLASAWEIVLRRAGRLGRALGEGRHAVLCINDGQHSAPDRTAVEARGSCVLFPPGDHRNLGYPHCSHAHCAHLTVQHWIDALGREAWESARLEARGMHRAGLYLLHPGGVSTWYRDADNDIVPARKDWLCDFMVRVTARMRLSTGLGARDFYEVYTVVAGRARTCHVPVESFADFAWVARELGDEARINPLPGSRARLFAAVMMLSDPIAARDAVTLALVPEGPYASVKRAVPEDVILDVKRPYRRR